MELVGQDRGLLDGWVIAQCHGLTLVGKVGPKPVRVSDGVVGVTRGTSDSARDARDGATLSPVYDLKTQLVPGQQGGAGIARMAFPLWLLPIMRIDLPDGCLCVSCESLSRTDQLDLKRAIDQAEEMLQQIRAASSGITTARVMPKNGGA